MASTHPLEIPEILLYVASYVSVQSLPVCARVSKSWHQAFMPAVWKEIDLSDYKNGAFMAIRSHRHLVKSFDLSSLLQEPVILPNLNSLSVVSPAVPKATKLILNHTSISHLRFNRFQPSPRLWSKLLGFPNLNRLELCRIKIDEKHIGSFWQLCTHLEHLGVRNSDIVDRGQLSSMEFPRLKELNLWQYDCKSRTVSLFMEFMSKCRGLTSCEWGSSPLNDEPFPPGFLQLLNANTWPHLHGLTLWEHKISQDDFPKIIVGIPRLASLDILCYSDAVKPDIMELLRPHFSRLTALRLRLVDERVMCPMAQEILSSCPLLESFRASRINATTVAEGDPWVCLGLKDLHLGFVFDPSTIRLVQPRVFDQLSRLTRLQYLYLWTITMSDGPIFTRFQKTVDLRLKNGLGRLSTLRALQHLEFDHSEQRMGDREIDWILEHWRCLSWIDGTFNTRKPKLDRALRNRLKDHGLEFVGSYDSEDETSESWSCSDRDNPEIEQ